MHRDLKLLNILLSDKSDKPRVKLADFGLAVALPPKVMIIKKAGTVAFMAPELVYEEPSDFKADIWSLGILLYTLISSRLPFDAGCYTNERIHEVIGKEIPFEGPEWQSVDPHAIDLIRNMLIFEQDQRYSIEQVLSHPWLAQESTV